MNNYNELWTGFNGIKCKYAKRELNREAWKRTKDMCHMFMQYCTLQERKCIPRTCDLAKKIVKENEAGRI